MRASVWCVVVLVCAVSAAPAPQLDQDAAASQEWLLGFSFQYNTGGSSNLNPVDAGNPAVKLVTPAGAAPAKTYNALVNMISVPFVIATAEDPKSQDLYWTDTRGRVYTLEVAREQAEQVYVPDEPMDLPEYYQCLYQYKYDLYYCHAKCLYRVRLNEAHSESVACFDHNVTRVTVDRDTDTLAFMLLYPNPEDPDDIRADIAVAPADHPEHFTTARTNITMQGVFGMLAVAGGAVFYPNSSRLEAMSLTSPFDSLGSVYVSALGYSTAFDVVVEAKAQAQTASMSPGSSTEGTARGGSGRFAELNVPRAEMRRAVAPPLTVSLVYATVSGDVVMRTGVQPASGNSSADVKLYSKARAVFFDVRFDSTGSSVLVGQTDVKQLASYSRPTSAILQVSISNSTGTGTGTGTNSNVADTPASEPKVLIANWYVGMSTAFVDPSTCDLYALQQTTYYVSNITRYHLADRPGSTAQTVRPTSACNRVTQGGSLDQPIRTMAFDQHSGNVMLSEGMTDDNLYQTNVITTRKLDPYNKDPDNCLGGKPEVVLASAGQSMGRAFAVHGATKRAFYTDAVLQRYADVLYCRPVQEQGRMLQETTPVAILEVNGSIGHVYADDDGQGAIAVYASYTNTGPSTAQVVRVDVDPSSCKPVGDPQVVLDAPYKYSSSFWAITADKDTVYVGYVTGVVACPKSPVGSPCTNVVTLFSESVDHLCCLQADLEENGHLYFVHSSQGFPGNGQPLRIPKLGSETGSGSGSTTAEKHPEQAQHALIKADSGGDDLPYEFVNTNPVGKALSNGRAVLSPKQDWLYYADQYTNRVLRTPTSPDGTTDGPGFEPVSGTFALMVNVSLVDFAVVFGGSGDESDAELYFSTQEYLGDLKYNLSFYYQKDLSAPSKPKLLYSFNMSNGEGFSSAGFAVEPSTSSLYLINYKGTFLQTRIGVVEHDLKTGAFKRTLLEPGKATLPYTSAANIMYSSKHKTLYIDAKVYVVNKDWSNQTILAISTRASENGASVSYTPLAASDDNNGWPLDRYQMYSTFRIHEATGDLYAFWTNYSMYNRVEDVHVVRFEVDSTSPTKCKSVSRAARIVDPPASLSSYAITDDMQMFGTRSPPDGSTCATIGGGIFSAKVAGDAKLKLLLPSIPAHRFLLHRGSNTILFASKTEPLAAISCFNARSFYHANINGKRIGAFTIPVSQADLPFFQIYNWKLPFDGYSQQSSAAAATWDPMFFNAVWPDNDFWLVQTDQSKQSVTYRRLLEPMKLTVSHRFQLTADGGLFWAECCGSNNALRYGYLPDVLNKTNAISRVTMGLVAYNIDVPYNVNGDEAWIPSSGKVPDVAVVLRNASVARQPIVDSASPKASILIQRPPTTTNTISVASDATGKILFYSTWTPPQKQSTLLQFNVNNQQETKIWVNSSDILPTLAFLGDLPNLSQCLQG